MAHECEPVPVASICVLTMGRWCLTLVRVVAELITGDLKTGDAVITRTAEAPGKK